MAVLQQPPRPSRLPQPHRPGGRRLLRRNRHAERYGFAGRTQHPAGEPDETGHRVRTAIPRCPRHRATSAGRPGWRAVGGDRGGIRSTRRSGSSGGDAGRLHPGDRAGCADRWPAGPGEVRPSGRRAGAADARLLGAQRRRCAGEGRPRRRRGGCRGQTGWHPDPGPQVRRPGAGVQPVTRQHHRTTAPGRRDHPLACGGHRDPGRRSPQHRCPRLAPAVPGDRIQFGVRDRWRERPAALVLRRPAARRGATDRPCAQRAS